MEAGNTSRIFDAGFVQVREWMLYKIREDHYPLNVVLSFESDRFDKDIFQSVIDQLIYRHEILRTTLQVIDGCLKQVIHHYGDYPVKAESFDVTGMGTAEKQRFLEDRKLLLACMPFNFEFGPLFRVSVFKLGDNRWEICWAFHHVIFDSYSASVFRA